MTRSMMPRHVAADDSDIGLRGGRLMDDAAVRHDDDAVGEFQDLVEVLADQEHCRA